MRSETPPARSVYTPRIPGTPWAVGVRGLRLCGLQWDLPGTSGPAASAPVLVMVHGWADVGASFQFLVDALAERLDLTGGGPRRIIAPDWRGFGRSSAGGSDAYWFPDYLGDLDALLDHFSPDQPVDLLGHSMGGNVVMSYAGVRPAGIRRLVNLEGFGLPRSEPSQAPARLAQWLDQLKTPQRFRAFASLEDVAQRLQDNNPRLPADKAAWLAPHWAEPVRPGQWQVRCDPAHKRVNPQLYRVDETLACWAAIQAPLLWVEGDQSAPEDWWGGRYTKTEFHERLDVVPLVQRLTLRGCGHMLHHDDPAGLAAALAGFLSAPTPPAPPAPAAPPEPA